MERLITRALDGLRAQGHAAYDPDTRLCRLRTDTGDKCFVGQLIDDEHYSPDLEDGANPRAEHHRATRVAICNSNGLSLALAEDYRNEIWDALEDMQQVHDQRFNHLEKEAEKWLTTTEQPDPTTSG